MRVKAGDGLVRHPNIVLAIQRECPVRLINIGGKSELKYLGISRGSIRPWMELSERISRQSAMTAGDQPNSELVG